MKYRSLFTSIVLLLNIACGAIPAPRGSDVRQTPNRDRLNPAPQAEANPSSSFPVTHQEPLPPLGDYREWGIGTNLQNIYGEWESSSQQLDDTQTLFKIMVSPHFMTFTQTCLFPGELPITIRGSSPISIVDFTIRIDEPVSSETSRNGFRCQFNFRPGNRFFRLNTERDILTGFFSSRYIEFSRIRPSSPIIGEWRTVLPVFFSGNARSYHYLLVGSDSIVLAESFDIRNGPRTIRQSLVGASVQPQTIQLNELPNFNSPPSLQDSLSDLADILLSPTSFTIADQYLTLGTGSVSWIRQI